MPASAPLPEPFQSGAFTTTDALSKGVTRRRLRNSDLATPFHRVRSIVEPADAWAKARAFRPLMRTELVFAGVTAARLWGLPVADRWASSESLVIGVPAGTSRTRAKGVRSLEFDATRLPPVALDGLQVLTPAAAVLSMARSATHEDLVVLIDALITPSKRYRDLRFGRRPHVRADELQAFLERCNGLRGVPAFSAALADARAGVDSPRETRTRLCILAAGLPEPVLQYEIWIDGRLAAEIDLAYPELKIAIEYEGEHHLNDPKQWAKDIRRQELLESLGWIVIRVTKADLRQNGRSLIRRIEDALARRAPRP